MKDCLFGLKCYKNSFLFFYENLLRQFMISNLQFGGSVGSTVVVGGAVVGGLVVVVVGVLVVVVGCASGGYREHSSKFLKTMSSNETYPCPFCPR